MKDKTEYYKVKKIPNIDPTSWEKWIRKDNYKMAFYRRSDLHEIINKKEW